MLIPEGEYTITQVQEVPERCHRITGPEDFKAVVWGKGGSSAYILRKFLEELFEGYAELHTPDSQSFTVRPA